MLTSRNLIVLVGALLAIPGAGCQGVSDGGDNGDGGADADTDSDSDADGGGDTDTEPGADNDGDGLSNGFEQDLGTDPNDEDTDNDGVSDFVEWVAGTDPLDPSSNPAAQGDFFFLIPYMGAPDPLQDTLVFETKIQVADVFLLMDTTGSMGGEITNLKNSLASVIIPGIQAIIPQAWFGVGFHDDYPIGNYGSIGDSMFGLLQQMTSDSALALAGVNLLTTHSGNDGPESQVPALWSIATGLGQGVYLPDQDGCGAGFSGYPCFRSGAIPIIILMTDAPFHNGPSNYQPYGTDVTPEPPSYNDAVAALDTIHAKVLPIYSGDIPGDVGNTHMDDIALDTGAQIDDVPLTFVINSDGSGLGTSAVEAVQQLATGVPMEISAAPRDDTTDAVDATAFIDRIVPNEAGGVEDPENPGVFCVGGLATVNNDADPYADLFADVAPDTSVCFDVVAATNEIVEPTTEYQLFTAYIDVIGDSVTTLDTREVLFLVPPSSPVF
jgi:hypothetical protein